ncbi:cytochrome oxidase putative small subunit CydP [Acinetobacter haemolyticus]|uniref:cytochrome oxidase putative small subunit CydP n=1 Tax=Acinetobacter haemolyticus TaxID=29430 RepID=UPI000D694A4A|nr:cytochrome oxidase putative small subunit CydP [Acinetobacter haemolyticus]
MNTRSQNSNRRLIREITIILIIKVALLLVIKHIWFDAPTIPKDFNNQVAERIAGNLSNTQETR